MTEETKHLTLMDQFKLFLWVYWKAGLMDNAETKLVLDFVKTMDDTRTVDACIAELDKLSQESA